MNMTMMASMSGRGLSGGKDTTCVATWNAIVAMSITPVIVKAARVNSTRVTRGSYSALHSSAANCGWRRSKATPSGCSGMTEI